ITGATHTGKTLAAQRLIEKLKYPCLSLDLLKMGLIRSGQTALTPMDDNLLTPYLWSIASEMIKTAIENSQHLIVEGCYVPFDWQNSFTPEYLREIRCVCLVMTEKYIRAHFDDIIARENVIEKRLTTDLTIEEALSENKRFLQGCRENCFQPVLIDEKYDIRIKID
ncbi:MAG: adenylate kinase, partial [Ruminococcus sp.]|nr:adenylate kinase [Ruminococcus sp.]